MKVLISGAGLSGNALAFWLGKAGHKVTVVERFPELRLNGLQLDLRGFGIEVLKRMGLEKNFLQKSAPETGMAYVNSKGKTLIFFGRNTSGEGVQNFTSEYEIMRGDFCKLLHDASLTHGDNVEYKFGTAIKSLDDTDKSGISVTFTSSETKMYDLVVGADGQWSHTRRIMLHGNDAASDPSLTRLRGHYTSYYTMALPKQPDEPYAGAIHIAPKSRTIMTRRHDADNIQVYLSLGQEGSVLEDVKHGDTAREKAIFAKAFQQVGWRAREFVEGMNKSDDFYCERIGFVRIPSWHRGRVALVGDAAYCPSLLTGMGTTSGVVGAYVLAGEISRIGAEHASLEVALAGYERVFRPFMEQVQEGLGEEGWLSDIFMPRTAFGIGLVNLFCRVMTLLRIEVPTGWLLKEKVEGWTLPSYKGMMQTQL